VALATGSSTTPITSTATATESVSNRVRIREDVRVPIHVSGSGTERVLRLAEAVPSHVSRLFTLETKSLSNPRSTFLFGEFPIAGTTQIRWIQTHTGGGGVRNRRVGTGYILRWTLLIGGITTPSFVVLEGSDLGVQPLA